jgi:hypothetical protein
MEYYSTYVTYGIVFFFGLVVGWALKAAGSSMSRSREGPDTTQFELEECRQQLEAKTNELLRLKMAADHSDTAALGGE